MAIFTRLLDKDDAPIYRNLRLKSYQEAPYSFSESYEDESQKSLESFAKELVIKGNPVDHFILGAFTDNQELVGFVKFRKDYRSKALHKSMIHAMYVSAEYRGQGIGRLLVKEVIKMAREIPSLEQIHLWVLHSKKAKSASDFYKSLGFESQGLFVKKDLKVGDIYVDAEYMVLYLA